MPNPSDLPTSLSQYTHDLQPSSPNPTFPPLLPQIISGNQESKFDSSALPKLSKIKVKVDDRQIISLGIDPNSFQASGGQPKEISLNQIKELLSSESLASLSGERTSARLKTALALYNQYFQDNFPGEEYNELRDHLKQRLLTDGSPENLHSNINASTDLGKIKQTCNEIGEFFSVIALKVEAIKSGDQAIDIAKEKDELKTLLTIFPSNQNADYACLDGTRQRLQTGTFSLFKPDVIAQLFEQEIDVFVAQHAKEVEEGNQIHMKSCLYGAISSLPYAELAKIDGFFLNPQDGLQLKDVLEFVDNLDDKIKQGLKTRISEIEEQFDKIFVQENTPPTAGMIKDFNSFLKINGFKEIDDAEFYETFCDENYLITKDSKDKLRIELLKSITATYPTLDKAKLEELFLEDTQHQQYLSTKIDLFYDEEQSSQQLDVGKIGNLITIFRDNSAGASSSQRQEPNIANIEKGLIVLRNVAQDFKNSNPFYFLEFFKQFEASTGTTFEDYFFEPSSQSQSQPSQPRQVKSQFKELEGIIKDITTREKNLSDILLQKPADQTIVQSPEEIARNQEIFDVCNAIFLGKEDEESEAKKQVFERKLSQDRNLADATYRFFLARENIFFKKLIESDNDKALAKLIDILPDEQKERLREYKPDGSNNLLHIASIVGSSKVIGVLSRNAGFDVDQVNPSGDTALMIASQNGHTQVAEALIRAGANLNLRDINYNTALMTALKNGHISVVNVLIEAMANLDLKDRDEDSALMYALKNGHTQVAEALIRAGAKIDLRDNGGGDTVLMFASQNGHTQVVKALIDKGANVDSKNNYLSTALMLAIKSSQTQVVEALIEGKANVDLQDRYGNTALMIALLYGRTSISETLIKAGADVDLKHKNGNTALMIASQKGNVEVVETLLQNGANLTGISNGFIQSIRSPEIQNTLQKYQDFYAKKGNDDGILNQIEKSLKEYLNGDKELNESSKIKFKDRNQQDQEIELNFNAISKIYKQENRLGSFDGATFSSSLATGLIPISTLINQVEERYPRPVATSTSASTTAVQSESAIRS